MCSARPEADGTVRPLSRRRLLPRSTALRIALTFVVLFGLGSTLMMAGVWWGTSRFLLAQVDQAIAEDLRELGTALERRGPRGLGGAVVYRARQAGEADAVFLLAAPDGTALAGNLSAWPETLPTDGWFSVARGSLPLMDVTDGPTPMDRDRGSHHRDRPPGGGMGPPPPRPPDEPLPWPTTLSPGQTPTPPALPWVSRDTRVRVAAVPLRDGFRLLVGRDLRPVAILQKRLSAAIRAGLFAMLGLGLTGGWWMSRRFSRRLEAINATSTDIMAGDLSRRIPERTGGGDDFDDLAANLNVMLTRIEALMAGVRHVSDTIAHDLRTPLARLRGRLETLAVDTAVPETRHGLGEALAEVDQLLATFNALLRIAQVESGGRRAAFAPLDLTPILADVVELYEALAEDKTVRLTWTRPDTPAPAPLNGDRDLLFQALSNLLDNAVKYTPPEGTVTVALNTTGQSHVVTIADSGPGIPAEDRRRVFERFYRVDTARSTPGNGLGLTMVGAVVEAHGGSISLDDSPDGGLRVTVTLPMAAGK